MARIEALARRLDTPRGLLVAFAALVAVRAAAALTLPWHGPGADSLVYDTLARGLSEGGAYQRPDEALPELNFMPGYPFLLSFVYRLFGGGYVAVTLVQVVLTAAASVLVQRTASRAWGAVGGLAAFSFLAVLPAITFYTTWRSAECLVLTLVAAYAYVLYVPAGVHFGAGRAAACGALTGALALCKPELVLWTPAPALVLWSQRRGLRRGLIAGAVALVACVVVVAPWSARNTRVAGHFLPFSVAGGRTFWLTAHRPSLTEFQEPEFVEAFERCGVESGGNPVVRDRCMQQGAVAMVKDHPLYYAVGTLPRATRFFFGSHAEAVPGIDGSFDDAARFGQYRVLCLKAGLLLAHVALYAFGLAGLARLTWRGDGLALAYLVGAKAAIHALLFSTPRYGLHVAPLLALGAGALAAHFAARRAPLASGQTAPAVMPAAGAA